MSEDRNTREYQFNVSGYIPGVPGIWSAGQRITIDEDTKEVLSVWPEPVEPPKEEQEEPAPETPPALDLSPEAIGRAMNTPIMQAAPDPAQQLSEAVKNL